MVLSQSRPLDHPDARRVGALAAALALNLAALVALTLPRELPFEPAPPKAISDIIIAEWVRPRPEQVAQPVPEIPPPPVRREPAPVPQVPVPVLDVPTALPVPATEPVTQVELAPEPAVAPVLSDRGASVAYDNVTPPPYPPLALKRGYEGVVVLNVLVGTDGRPEAVEIERGSGHRVLDVSARRHVLATWRFHPAIVSGEPVRAWAKVPVAFRIADG